MIVNIAGGRLLGLDSFREAMSAALASPLAAVLTEVAIDDIRAANHDTAIVSCTKTVHDHRPEATATDHDALPTQGVLTYVMVRASRTWKIALAQTTPIVVGP